MFQKRDCVKTNDILFVPVDHFEKFPISLFLFFFLRLYITHTHTDIYKHVGFRINWGQRRRERLKTLVFVAFTRFLSPETINGKSDILYNCKRTVKLNV